MICDILKPAGAPVVSETTSTNGGKWVYRQNEDSGAIERVWDDNPVTEEIETDTHYTGEILRNVPLIARSVVSQGTTAAGATEKFNTEYMAVDYVRAYFPKNINISKRDRVTNIRSKRGNDVLWREEEMDDSPPTVFDVMGIQPVIDPFGRLVEQIVLMQRASVQGG